MFIIRNDDIGFDTKIEEISTFCGVCDKYGYQIIQAISPIGECRKARAVMSNEQIRLSSFKRFEENKEVVEFLKKRRDFIGIHGLWHTHQPSLEEITTAKSILESLGLNPTYFVPPFNEGEYPKEIMGLKTCQLSIEKGERLEDFLKAGEPKAPIMYLHSWRFNNKYYTFGQLDQCLKRLSITQVEIKKLDNSPVCPFRLWYNKWIKENAYGKVLDVGKSIHWDYGFPTFDIDPRLKPTYLGNIEKTKFPDETFDTILCNGMYEFTHDPQKMIDEVLRITKKGGKVIFGFVGKNYKPYRKPWKYYEGKEKLPNHIKADFGEEYHFLICQKS